MNIKKLKTVFVFSGKRKSGKDYVTEKLQNIIGKELCYLIRLSSPLKCKYAEENNLDYELLLTSNDYKEKFRHDMIKWGEEKRNLDPEYFCRAACSSHDDKSIWIITDARRPSDIRFFKNMPDTMLFLVRLEASNETRRFRGWEYVRGVDDCASECALDSGVEWDFVITNDNKDDAALSLQLQQLIDRMNTKCI